MAHSDHFLKLYDGSGKLISVMLSAELWGKGSKIERAVIQTLESLEPTLTSEPLAEWEEFKSLWDFKYPFEASVHCESCGESSADWTTDPDKKFTLKSAQLGGLVVFTCNRCGATVRKKHFKDHTCFEATPTK